MQAPPHKKKRVRVVAHRFDNWELAHCVAEGRSSSQRRNFWAENYLPAFCPTAGCDLTSHKHPRQHGDFSWTFTVSMKCQKWTLKWIVNRVYTYEGWLCDGERSRRCEAEWSCQSCLPLIGCCSAACCCPGCERWECCCCWATMAAVCCQQLLWARGILKHTNPSRMFGV